MSGKSPERAAAKIFMRPAIVFPAPGQTFWYLIEVQKSEYCEDPNPYTNKQLKTLKTYEILFSLVRFVQKDKRMRLIYLIDLIEFSH